MKYFFLLFLVGCGRIDLSARYPVPVVFQPFVSTFKNSYGGDFSFVSYSFSNLGFTVSGGGVIGECSIPSMVVSVDSNFWGVASDLQKEQLLLHELGHCVLGRAHLNSVSFGRDVSLMNAYAMPSNVYSQFHSYYLGELFNSDVPQLAGYSQPESCKLSISPDF